jgi:DNA-binding NarL/FixJ family response regulator
LLGAMPGVQVVAEAGDGREAIKLIEEHRPHVVLMDIMMPGLNGLDSLVRIAKHFPDSRVIMLTMNASEEYVLQAMRAGAAGYLLKNISPSELELAIRAVARGETFLNSAVSKHVIEGYLRRVGDQKTPRERLTPRQREVLQLIAEGLTTKEIAHKLGVTVKTVETHRSQLMQQLDIHDIAGLVRYAVGAGIISASE